jgi:hypothetical protein
MSFDYYLQHPKSPSLRRYPKGSDVGQRWDVDDQKWTDKCCERSSCILTKDKVLTEAEAEASIANLKGSHA